VSIGSAAALVQRLAEVIGVTGGHRSGDASPPRPPDSFTGRARLRRRTLAARIEQRRSIHHVGRDALTAWHSADGVKGRRLLANDIANDQQVTALLSWHFESSGQGRGGRPQLTYRPLPASGMVGSGRRPRARRYGKGVASRRVTERSLLAARLAAQLLSGPPAADVVKATRHLLAVQAQDPRGARLALRVRTAGGYASDIDRALTCERSLIITWVNRGTLHLIAAEDEALLHALTTPQLRSSSDRRLRQEGVTPGGQERGVAAIVKALGNHGPMTRAQLRSTLEAARVPVAGQALVHILFRATLEGLIIRGPVVGGDHAFALVADWLGERPKIDRDGALAELARRYLAGHGPADERDLAKWAQLPLRDARAGLTAIASELEQRAGGLIDLRRDGLPPLPPPRLLGPFDPLLLGWRSRELVLDHPPEVVTVNGIIKAIALVAPPAPGRCPPVTLNSTSGKSRIDRRPSRLPASRPPSRPIWPPGSTADRPPRSVSPTSEGLAAPHLWFRHSRRVTQLLGDPEILAVGRSGPSRHETRTALPRGPRPAPRARGGPRLACRRSGRTTIRVGSTKAIAQVAVAADRDRA